MDNVFSWHKTLKFKMAHVEKCVSHLSRIPLPHHPVPISRGKQYLELQGSFPWYFMHTHKEMHICFLLFLHEGSRIYTLFCT